MNYMATIFDTNEGKRVLAAIETIAENLKKIANAKGDLSSETIEKIYRKREHQYLLEDAHSHFVQYIFGDEEVTDEQIEHEIHNLKSSHGNNIFEKFVREFEDLQDCNVADNNTWEVAIKNVLAAE